MPWFFDVHYGEPVISTVTVEIPRASYFAALIAADEAGHRPKRCRKSRAEYSHFTPSPGSYGSKEYVKPEPKPKKENTK